MTQKSRIKGVGILDPGPIDNSDLFDSECKVKSGLTKNLFSAGVYNTTSYTVLSEDEWNFLWTHYGGGPIIKRTEEDIYSEILDPAQEKEDFDKVKCF